MTSREQFEEWYSRETGVSIRLLKVLRARDDYSETVGDRLSLAWMAWQASRDALGIDGMSGLKTKLAAEGPEGTLAEAGENLGESVRKLGQEILNSTPLISMLKKRK